MVSNLTIHEYAVNILNLMTCLAAPYGLPSNKRYVVPALFVPFYFRGGTKYWCPLSILLLRCYVIV